MSEQESVHCSFCNKARREVRKLVSGPNVFICDECIGLCNDILAEERDNALAEIVKSPKKLLAELDQHVVGCAAAKRALVAAVILQHAIGALAAPALRILIVGPSGSGKTTLGRALVDSVPDSYATDVGRLSETGYVGDDVEHVLWGLFDRVEANVDRAERGVVFLDGVEKLHAQRPLTRARDISGESVQRELLRLLGGTRATVPRLGGALHPMQKDTVAIETRRILVVAAVRTEGWEVPTDASERAVRDALVEHGLLGAFVARFDRIIRLTRPERSDTRAIAARLVDETTRRAAALKTTLVVTPAAIDALAAAAAASGDGAWALRGPLHRMLEDVLLANELGAPRELRIIDAADVPRLMA